MLKLLLALLMATRTGTPSQVNASAGNGSTSVTVPAAANLVVAFWSHWDENAGSSLATLTLNGVGFTIASQLAEGATNNESGVGVARLASPATGSQTLAWTWSAGGARTEGGEIVLVYVQDGNISDPVRAGSTDANTGAGDVTVTVGSVTTDLVLAFAGSTSPTAPAINGTVFINDATLNGQIYDVSEVTAGASSTVVTMTGENNSAMAAISLKTSGLTLSPATGLATLTGFAPNLTASASAALSGTIISATTETDIVNGGKTIIITLSGTTWVP